MATAGSALADVPTALAPLVGLSEDARLEALGRVHPDYATHSASWQVLLDAFEGAGGFLDGSYLWSYPAESASDYTARKAQARYHNYVDTLIDLYVRFVFTQGVKRDSKSDQFNDWMQDVDGAGTSLTELLKRGGAVSLLHGHAGILVDRTPEPAEGPSRADERARTIATLYPATAISDWRLEHGRLTAVKLREAAPQPGLIEEMPTGEEALQYLLWDEEGWARFDHEGMLLDAGLPGLGLVPLVLIRPAPSIASPFLGRGVIANANLVRALFNRASEEDEVLRKQSFSVLTVEVDPQTGNVEEARDQIGRELGASKAIVVGGKIDYKTPDQQTTVSLRENAQHLVQELYRSAHVRFRRDTLSSETAEAIRLQYTELNEMLQGFAKALTAAEHQIARAWFAWDAPTPEAAAAAYDAAKVQVEYPSEFFLDALITDLEAWAEAIRMDLGETMTKRIKKRAVRRIEPDMDPEDLAAVDAEIDAQKDPVLPEPMAVPGEVPADLTEEMVGA